MNSMSYKNLKIAAVLCALLLAPLAAAAPAPQASSPGSAGAAIQSILAPRPGCKHNYKKQTKRVHVPPKYANQLVGYDKKGRPIYKRVLVRAGYYKTVSVYKCSKCGKTK